MRVSPFACGPTRMVSGGWVAPATPPGPEYEYGPQLVVNGEFGSGTTGWTASDATLAAVEGELRVTATDEWPQARQTVSVDSGYDYEIVVHARQGTAGSSAEVYYDRGAGNMLLGTAGSAGREIRGVVRASGSSLDIILSGYASSNGMAFFFDAVSLRQITLPAGRIPALDAQPVASSMAKPAMLAPKVFDAFGMTIMRLTNSGPLHQYSTRPMFSSDQSKVILHGSGKPYTILDIPDGTVFRSGVSPTGQFAFCDPVDPDVVWLSDDSASRIGRYSIAGNSPQMVTIPGSYDGVIIGEHEGAISDDGRWLVLTGHKSDGAYVIVFDAATDSVVDTLTLSGWAYGAGGLDNVKISPSGQYIVISSDKSDDFGYHIYDRETLTRERSWVSESIRHMDIGYRADGDECMITQDDEGNVVSVRLSDGDERVEIRSELMSWGQHTCAQNRRRKGWAYLSMYYDEFENDKPLARELLAVRLDGKQTIERWGQSMFPASGSYDLQAKACASPDGDMLVMTSGWGTTDAETYLVGRPEVMPEPSPGIEFVAASTAEAASLTMPEHEEGDLLVVFAFTDHWEGSPPSLPDGWTSIGSGSNAPMPFRIGHKVATSDAETSGTWTWADHIAVYVYRGVGSVGASAAAKADESNNVAYPGLTLTGEGSIVLCLSAVYRETYAIETPPDDTVLRSNEIVGTCEFAAFDTDGPVEGWAGDTVSIGGTAGEIGWVAATIELVPM